MLNQPSGDSPPSSTHLQSDHELIGRLERRDGEALKGLMERYDRLVRFTIFRCSRIECRRDPTWLDSVASEVWTGFMRTLARNPDTIPRQLKTYFIQIARNKCTDALRHGRRGPTLEPAGDEMLVGLSDPAQSAVEILTAAEDIARLRECVSRLSPQDQALCSQMPQIMKRRWREVGRSLGMAESTVRSRWPGVLKRLKDCLESSMGE